MTAMLDELLGRAPLKSQIEELEAELEGLRGQLEGERERRREAVRGRQEAEERVNRLEDRIADLEGQLDRVRDGEPALRFRGTETLSGERLREVLARLESVRTGPESAFSAVVEERPDEATRDAFGDRAALLERAAPCLAYTDDAGLVSVALRPALPPEPFAEWDDRFRVERGWFLPEGSFAVALVRSDLFAFGEYDGGERVEFEGFATDVMGSHSKGGFSQARFERRRDEQVDEHLDRCREAIDERDPDRLIVVGQRTVLDEFEALAVATAAVDATGDPKDALDHAVRDFFSAEIYRV